MLRRHFLATVSVVLAGCTSPDSPSDGYELTLAPSPDRGELPKAEFEVEVENNGDEPYTTTPTSLLAAKLDEGEPRYLRPLFVHLRDGPALEIQPGESDIWAVEIDNEEQGFMRDSGGQMLSLTGLGPGTYLFGFQGPNAYTVDEDLAAEVELTGEAPEVTPAWVEYTEETDDGLRVDVGVMSDEDGDEETDIERNFEVLKGSEVVERAPEEVPSLLTEQVMQMKVTRNAVHYLGGEDGHRRMVMEGRGVLQDLEYVDLAEATAGSHPFFAASDGAYYFMYDEVLYEVNVVDG